ncbi:hypothetical protein L3556_08400 [Candidatus Synechococcus calcipolaris G9]|uniref:Uncharacterized protein n=1 Tax=Candidatus Synechococcus calcipolaris G9 TaxID=1497997 RepID=A0ABT6EZE8_9SYNE|nr:hypothetical protein [Candidatus Synechococcus calcipolaris]MDG2990946.1 hypothetical protein [Candidatus Synechococcus calcipolaris G9]
MFRSMFLLLSILLVAGVWNTLPAPARDIPQKLARRHNQGPPKVVKVTEAQVVSDNINGIWYHSLSGQVVNETGGTVRNIQVYYEIYQPGTNRLVDAGATTVKPSPLLANAVGNFRLTSNQGGQVKITLVEWLSGDRGYHSHPQMEEFPAQ